MGLVNLGVKYDDGRNSPRFKTFFDDQGGVYKKCGINHIFMNFTRYTGKTTYDLIIDAIASNHRIHIFISDERFIHHELQSFVMHWKQSGYKKVIIHIPKKNKALTHQLKATLGEVNDGWKIVFDSKPTEFYMSDDWGFSIGNKVGREHCNYMFDVEMCFDDQDTIRYWYREKTHEELVEENRRMFDVRENRKRVQREKAAERMAQISGNKT